MKPEEIRARREHLKLTQKQLGAAFGVTWNTIARWERGELNPTAPGMMQLAFQTLELTYNLDRDGELSRLKARAEAKMAQLEALRGKMGRPPLKPRS